MMFFCFNLFFFVMFGTGREMNHANIVRLHQKPSPTVVLTVKPAYFSMGFFAATKTPLSRDMNLANPEKKQTILIASTLNHQDFHDM